MFKSLVCPIELGSVEGMRRMWGKGGSREKRALSCSWRELAITPTSLPLGHFPGLPILGALQKPCWAESALCLGQGHSSTNQDAGAESEDRGSFKDVRKSTLELPMLPTLPRTQPHPRLSWQAFHAELWPLRFLGGPHCPRHRPPTGTEERTLDQAEEERMEGETEQILGSQHFKVYSWC